MTRKNLILGGVLIILVAAAFIIEGPLQSWRQNHNLPDNPLAGIDFDQVNAIDVNYQGKTVTIERDGDKWKIAGTKGFYVSDDVMNAVTSAVTDATKAPVEVVSENPDKKGDFGVTTDEGAEVTLRQSDTELAKFYVGQVGDDYSSTYVALPDDSQTYLVKAGLNAAFWRPDWYDRTIFSSDGELITNIRFQYPTREFTVEKDGDGVWSGTLPYKFTVDEDKISPVVDIMSNLQAADIPEQTFDGTGLEKNSIIIQATGDGIDNTLMVGDAKTSGTADTADDNPLYYAKRGDSDNIYLITKEQRDELFKQIRDLQ